VRSGFITDSPYPKELHLLEKVSDEKFPIEIESDVKCVRQLEAGNGSDAETWATSPGERKDNFWQIVLAMLARKSVLALLS